jgi:4-amino-4-deoxy-L-arabinose transferase-like glycosyltransferase
VLYDPGRVGRQPPLALLLAMLCIGLGFTIKMLQAYLVLPAIIFVYLLTPVIPFKKRFWHLAAAGVVLVLVSFSWATVVELTPAKARPYVGSSGDNSIYHLTFGYNGINRLLPKGWSIFGITNGSSTLGDIPVGGGDIGGVSENGPKGIFRLLDTNLGGQIGWLLPLAVIGLLVTWRRPLLRGFDAQKRSLVLWGTWLVTQVAFFSVAGFYHWYDLSMLSPAIAALTGIGLVSLWGHSRQGGW